MRCVREEGDALVLMLSFKPGSEHALYFHMQDKDSKCGLGETALWCGCCAGKSGAVAVLLKLGADPNIKTVGGMFSPFLYNLHTLR